MLKRFASLLLALLLLTGIAFAEGMPTFEAYTTLYAAPEGTEWTQEDDLCLLELENDISIHICLVGEDVVALTVVSPAETDFSQTAIEAIRGLNILSEESLEQISILTEETELEGYLLTPMNGKSYAGIAIRSAQSDIEWVWQPLRGGEKYHAKSICGRTEAPRLETKEVAEALGFTPCSRCFKDETQN